LCNFFNFSEQTSEETFEISNRMFNIINERKKYVFGTFWPWETPEDISKVQMIPNEEIELQRDEYGALKTPKLPYDPFDTTKTPEVS
jgi:hypothetical protein